MRRLQEGPGGPLDELLTLWVDIDVAPRTPCTIGYSSIRPSSIRSIRASRPFAGTPIELTGHETTVLAALRLSAADLAAIQGEATGADTVSLPSLSILCRHAVLARMLRLSLSEVLVLRRLIADNPFEARNPLATSTFIDQVAEIRAAGFTIAELAYLYLDPVLTIYRHALQEYVARVSDGLRPGEKEIQALALTLAVEPPAAPTTDDAGTLPTPSAENVRAVLAELGVPDARITATLTFLEESQADTPTNITAISRLFAAFIPPDAARAALLDTAEVIHSPVTSWSS